MTNLTPRFKVSLINSVTPQRSLNNSDFLLAIVHKVHFLYQALNIGIDRIVQQQTDPIYARHYRTIHTVHIIGIERVNH